MAALPARCVGWRGPLPGGLPHGVEELLLLFNSLNKQAASYGLQVKKALSFESFIRYSVPESLHM